MLTKALISIPTNAVEEMVKKELVKFDDEATLSYGSKDRDWLQRIAQEVHSTEILDDKPQSRGV